ncbi:MAG: UPF0149 family protein [Paraperlucidibaca sp.]
MQAALLPSLESLALALADVNADCSSSELHGLISGLLVAGARLNRHALMKALESHAEPASTFSDAMIASLWQLQLQTLEDLNADELSFKPMLPDDEEPLKLRVVALADFCRGLLAGIGLGAPANSPVLAEASMRETLQDLAHITQVDGVDDDDEEGETAYLELHEFVRLASMHLFEEMAPREEHAHDAPESDDQTFH